MMFIRLLPDQVSNMWNIIEPALEASLPPIAGSNKDRMKNMMISMLCGKLDCWILFEANEEEKNIISGFLTTTIIKEEITGSNTLLIYSVFSDSKFTQENLWESFNSLKSWAKLNHCESISAYSNIPSIISLVRRLGGNIEQIYLSLPVK